MRAVDTMLAGLRGDFPRYLYYKLTRRPHFGTDEGCIVQEKGLPYFRDTSHLTNEGSALLAERMKGDMLAIIGYGAMRSDPFSWTVPIRIF